MRNQGFIFVFLVGIGVVGYAANPVTPLPGVASRVISPNGEYAVLNVDYDDRTPNHALLLVVGTEKQGTFLYPYGRHVDVSWAPDSAHLFINDYKGSDNSTCLIYDLKKKAMIDLINIFEKYDPKNSTIFDSDHTYITCTGWASKSKLIIKVSGRNSSDKAASEIQFTYVLGGKPTQE